MVASFTVGTRKSSNVSNAIAASYMYRFTINLFFVWLPGLFHVHSYLGCLVNHVFRITCLFCSHHSTNLFPLPFILPIPLLPTMSSCFCFTNSALEDPFITIISINDHFCHFHFLYHFHWVVVFSLTFQFSSFARNRSRPRRNPTNRLLDEVCFVNLYRIDCAGISWLIVCDSRFWMDDSWFPIDGAWAYDF